MDKVIISDASCLIALFEIGKIHILKEVFTQIVTTKEVALEFGHDIPSWISIKKPANDITKNELERVLDSGEASAIALALENPSQSILIIDEKKGRKVAIENHLEVIGTLRVLLLAKEKHVILSVKETITELAKRNFRFSQEIIKQILLEAKE
ncbi:MAG: DUF3368 domain-containing protein [Bacteroidetes bacterium]|nr:DUF3368 domain-containing protein [Bacteroidota bacterium]